MCDVAHCRKTDTGVVIEQSAHDELTRDADICGRCWLRFDSLDELVSNLPQATRSIA